MSAGSPDVWLDRAVTASQVGRHAEAEAGFKAVLAMDPDHGEAHFGLGLCLMAARRFEEAVAPLRRAASQADAQPIRQICLGQALYMNGAFGPSAEAFDVAARQTPLPHNAWLTWARAKTFEAIVQGDTDIALRQYPLLAGKDGEDVLELAQDALSIFGVFGQIQAARSVGRWLMARRPDDCVLAYRVQVLEGAPFLKAPAAYVEAHFDAFSDRFDHQLQAHLQYQAPQSLSDLIASRRTVFEEILDLGCGTGLAAPALSRFGGRLTGVDLSARMLAKSAERGAYDDLVKAEALAFLQTQTARFDLLFAADVLIYFGDLADLLAAAGRALRPGGYLALTTEIAPQGWTLLSSGRFSHARDYVVATAEPHLEILNQRGVTLRREGLTETFGDLHLLRRRTAAL
jgi:predicted TPR repeat methyltransferase